MTAPSPRAAAHVARRSGRRLRSDLKERVSIEIARIRLLPAAEQESELFKLKARRDRLEGDLDVLTGG